MSMICINSHLSLKELLTVIKEHKISIYLGYRPEYEISLAKIYHLIILIKITLFKIIIFN